MTKNQLIIIIAFTKGFESAQKGENLSDTLKQFIDDVPKRVRRFQKKPK